MRPGDWTCECGKTNFAFRTECFGCNVPKPENAPVVDASGFGGAQTGYGQREFKPNWACLVPECAADNFGRRDACFKCHAPRGDAPDAEMPTGGWSQRDRRPQQFKEGDWECSCGSHNFARRNECFKCRSART